MGFNSFNEIPFTLKEVNNIKKINAGVNLYTGEMVSESHIKKLSKQGELKKYEVIHFATHGVVIPEIPELSALVLSQPEKSNEEDGFLNMEEIALLDLQADFINLSACETGLGKVYGGEGVVGLTQAFLVAGANGLAVSLWQVADKSTMEFMTGLYDLAKRKKISYDRAITKMKRRFIKDKKYSNPFYWAPFVYYGN